MPTDPDDLVTTVLEGSGQTIPLAGIDLVVIEGADRGVRAGVGAGITRIGTSASSHLRLTDRTASRVHCELRLRNRAVQIVDAGSTNGTFVEGVRIADAELPPGAVVRVGTTAIRIEAANAPTRVPISSRDHFGELLGASLAMRRVYAMLERVAATDTTVLIHGETGTGKELAARAVHEASRRARGPFVAVDCGAIAESLIESELFGHVRGAFSGAHAERRGLFEEADGGTLFLDEIGELPLSLQPRLLRVLEAREVRRVGANASRPIDVRVLAATNRSLAQSVNDGTFREDLYYRLAVVEVELPPLRARRDDSVDARAALLRARSAAASSRSPRPSPRPSRRGRGRATCASCATSSSAASRWGRRRIMPRARASARARSRARPATCSCPSTCRSRRRASPGSTSSSAGTPRPSSSAPAAT